MKRKFWLLALVGVVLLTAAPVLADDGFYVIAGSGPPVGTKITSLPYTINNPGLYFLTGNLTYNSTTGNAITVNSNNVTLDLMGFKLTGLPTSIGVSAYGIYMSGRTNVEVRNGTVWGFDHAVYEDNATNGKNHRVINVRVSHAYNGIFLAGKNHLIKNCSGVNNANWAFAFDSGLITDCVAANNVTGIITAGPCTVLRNTVYNSSSNNFILGNGNATSILVDRNSAYGLSSPHYWIRSSGVVITANNSGTP
jgi:hypothetical protein